MLETIVELGVAALGIYLGVGLVIAIALHAGGLRRIDPSTAGAGWWFRLLITPGLVALWPVMVRRWRGNPGNSERSADDTGLRARHRRLATSVAVVVPALVIVGLVARPPAPAADPSAREVVPEPAPLETVVLREPAPFTELPIAAAIRSDRTGALQLELEVARDLEIPGLLGYWSPTGSSSGASFLGLVWGPGTRRFALPAEAAAGGEVSLFSTGHGDRVAEWRHGPVGGE